MNRKGFLKLLGAAIVAPFVGKGTPKEKSTFADDVQRVTGHPYILKNTRWHKIDELYGIEIFVETQDGNRRTLYTNQKKSHT